jgi:glycosyltransferase involved in cell wall biosynthesis
VGVFLRAAQAVSAQDPDARFFIGGAGNLAPYRTSLAALGDRVTVVNRELSNDETDRVMQESWAVVLPYTSATQSGVVPVAYWNACPVIVTDVGALSEAVDEAQSGFLVPPGDAAALAARMRLLADPSRRRVMGRAAFALYQDRFRWDQWAGGLVERFSREAGRAPITVTMSGSMVPVLSRQADNRG